MTVRERLQEWSDKKRAAGLCPRCGKKPPKKDRELCKNCLLKARRRRIRLYQMRLRQGLCPHCGSNREDPGIISCRKCEEKNTERRVRLYNKEKKAVYQMRLYRKRRRAGDCPVCGRGIDDSQFKLCSSCRQQGRGYYYLHRDDRLAANKIHYQLNHKPKALCEVCGLHRLRCSCGKMMKVHHGAESCLFTCRCGAVITRLREAIVK